MAADKKIENSEPVVAVLKSDFTAAVGAHEAASGKDGTSSDLISISSLVDATSSIKGEIDRGSVGEHGVYYPPTSCYNYYYPGYGGSYTQLDDNAYFPVNSSQSGLQSDNGSLVYYLPGYNNAYASGSVAGVDGQGVGQQQYFSSSGYLQPPVSYGSEALPCYSWDTTYIRDVQSAGNVKSGSVKSNGFNSTNSNGNFSSKFSKSVPPVQATKSLNKGYPSAGTFSSYNQKQGIFPYNFPMSYSPNGRTWNSNDRLRSKDKMNRNEDFEGSTELTRGPRSHSKNSLDSSVEKEELGVTNRRDKYNLPEFQTEYENAKFYIIKSYSEDDIHKCVKYDVWSSTPNGNKKLDAAFHDAEAKASETDTECPIFLFFSVNGSGQFVGLAEMTGAVDFDKDMDFWQVDKWSGFFQVKWHIIKDIPNSQLRHITLENNDNRPVTFTRDTHEIGIKQGLEMLKIFKNFTSKTSLLDDFIFYENREKSLRAKRGNKPATLKMELSKPVNAERKAEFESVGMKMTSGPASLISLTKNLSLNSGP